MVMRVVISVTIYVYGWSIPLVVCGGVLMGIAESVGLCVMGGQVAMWSWVEVGWSMCMGRGRHVRSSDVMDGGVEWDASGSCGMCVGG